MLRMSVEGEDIMLKTVYFITKILSNIVYILGSINLEEIINYLST